MAKGKEKKNPTAEFEKRQQELIDTGRYEDVYLIAVPKGDGDKLTACYIKKPGIDTLEMNLAVTNQGQPITATKALIKAEWIEGDEEILEDTDMLLSAHATIQGLVQVRVGVLKKKSKNIQ